MSPGIFGTHWGQPCYGQNIRLFLKNAWNTIKRPPGTSTSGGARVTKPAFLRNKLIFLKSISNTPGIKKMPGDTSDHCYLCGNWYLTIKGWLTYWFCSLLNVKWMSGGGGSQVGVECFFSDNQRFYGLVYFTKNSLFLLYFVCLLTKNICNFSVPIRSLSSHRIKIPRALSS